MDLRLAMFVIGGIALTVVLFLLVRDYLRSSRSQQQEGENDPRETEDSDEQGYHASIPDGVDHDSAIPWGMRNKPIRWVHFIVVTALIFGTPAYFLYRVGTLFDYFYIDISLLLLAVGVSIGGWFYAKVITDYLIVYVPLLQAFVTQDRITGHRIGYGPGWHPTYFWEERTRAGNFSLNLLTQIFEEEVPTKDAEVIATVSFQYKAWLKWIINFALIDQSTIDSGLIAFIRTFLSEELAGKTSNSARSEATIKTLNRKLKEKFGAIGEVEYEEKYGILVSVIAIEGIDLTEKVQTARDAIAEAEQQMVIVAKMQGLTLKALREKREKGEITDEMYQSMLDRAMAMSDNATLQVNVIHGSAADAINAALAKTIGGNPPGRSQNGSQ